MPEVRSIVVACISACAVSLPAHAQQRTDDAPAPPQLEALEEGSAPAEAIRPAQPGATAEEKRTRGGRVTEITVTSRGSTYLLKPNEQPGSAVAGDLQGSRMRAAQWEIMRFNLFGAKPPEKHAGEPAAEPPGLPRQ